MVECRGEMTSVENSWLIRSLTTKRERGQQWNGESVRLKNVLSENQGDRVGKDGDEEGEYHGNVIGCGRMSTTQEFEVAPSCDDDSEAQLRDDNTHRGTAKWRKCLGFLDTWLRHNHWNTFDEKLHIVKVSECEALFKNGAASAGSWLGVRMWQDACLERDCVDDAAWKHDDEEDDCKLNMTSCHRLVAPHLSLHPAREEHWLYRGRRRTESHSASPHTGRHSHLWGSSGHRLPTSTTRATVEGSTAGLGPTREERPLVGGFSFHDVSGLCANFLAHGLPGGIQAQDMRHAPDGGLVSCHGGRTPACDTDARVEAAWTRPKAQ